MSTDIELLPGKNLFIEGGFDRDYTTREELESEVQEGIAMLRERGYSQVSYVIASRLGPEYS